METDTCVKSSPDSQRVMIAATLANLVDLYWLALAPIQNILEDIAGSDGRLEYLISLQCKLIEVCQEMDDLLAGVPSQRSNRHRLAVALERGLPHLGMSAGDLMDRLITHSEMQHDELQAALLAFGQTVVGHFPGQIPDAQGPLGQAQTLRAMRNWSVAAIKTGDDLGFLAERFRNL